MSDDNVEIRVVGAKAAADHELRKARYIERTWSGVADLLGNYGQNAARAYSLRPARTRGANLTGERSGNLRRAIQSSSPKVMPPFGGYGLRWQVVVETVKLANLKRIRYDRPAEQPQDYVAIVEEGRPAIMLSRGNLMRFPETRPGFPPGVFRTQRVGPQQGKHMFRDAARDINSRYAPRTLRDYTRRLGNL